ncbi:MAG TPA: EAL domain-containing protein [Candidatus Limnocylindrales bacterium]|nr:EAL domain-containing protein [Candidatus Limnocylindrales bacterium]
MTPDPPDQRDPLAVSPADPAAARAEEPGERPAEAPAPTKPEDPPVVAAPIATRRPADDVGSGSADGFGILVPLVRLISVAAIVVGAIEILAGLVFREPRAIALGSVSATYGVWVATRLAALGGPQREATITRIAAATLGVIGLAATFQPSIATAMAIASLLPAVIVTPIVASRIVLRLLILGGIVAAWSEVAAAVLQEPSRLPEPAQAGIAFLILVLAYAFLVIFLWEVSRRLKNTATDLQSVVAMSGDLAETLDPRLVGDRIAFHIARAVGADDCALSYWDRVPDRVVTLGYFPPERRDVLSAAYALDDYPATKAVLLEQRAILIDVADPAAEPTEVDYLASIGQRSMAMIPLVAAGRTIGLIEVTSARPTAFGARSIELATMLAGEAAMALENARLYDEIRHQALHDGLTELANRVLFRDRVEHAVERCRRNGGEVAILFIDLDDFKTLNDTHGHARGDEVLIAAAGRVSAVLRPSDTAARLGGDEFAVLIEDVADEADALAVATRLADALRQPLPIGHSTVHVAASIGVAIGGSGGETTDDLLRNADVAMYAAKDSSRGGAVIFRPALRQVAAERSAMAALLRGAQERDELRLDYQPIVDLSDGSIVGLEALVRWQPSDGPILMPGDWIDLAEETGDIVPIGRWILREACRQARDWQIRLGRPDLRISVNLSARQFREHDIVGTVRSVLTETGVPPGTLILEITESGLMRQTQSTIARLDALRALGCHLAIDDFGTGYSSLSYLERFPIDILKIDRSFVSDGRTGGSAIARAIIDLGRTLNLEVIAEGIEQSDQARWLVEMGCRFGQGYLFARPVGAAAVEALLAEGAGLGRAIDGAGEGGAGGVGANVPAATGAKRLRLVSGE